MWKTILLLILVLVVLPLAACMRNGWAAWSGLTTGW